MVDWSVVLDTSMSRLSSVSVNPRQAAVSVSVISMSLCLLVLDTVALATRPEVEWVEETGSRFRICHETHLETQVLDLC